MRWVYKLYARKVAEEYMKRRLEINASQTYLVVSGVGEDLDLETKVIRAPNNFKYLGIIIRPNVDSNENYYAFLLL